MTASSAPTAALLDLPFNEGSGPTTTNTGNYGGLGTFDFGAPAGGAYPQFSSAVPTGPWAPAGNVSSVDFGTLGSSDGGRGIDYPSSTAAGLGGPTPATGLMGFTLAGWINLHATEVGPGGNRILSTWPNGATGTLGTDRQRGIDLVVITNSTASTTAARLRLGVNAAPDQDVQGPYSSNGKVLVGQWVFFAVTYSNGLAAYFFGDGHTPAALDVSATYNRQGVVNSGLGVTVGNFQPAGGNGTIRDAIGGGSRVLRGLVDELKVYAEALSLAQIQTVQTNGFLPAALAAFAGEPVNQAVHVGQDATFSVSVTGTPPISYQWQRDNMDIPGATESSYTVVASTAGDNHAQFRVVVTNPAGTVTSSNATLQVTTDNTPPTVVAVETARDATTLIVSFSEPVEENSATDLFAYYFASDPLGVTDVDLQPNLTNVTLTTEAMTPGRAYTLTIENVRDRALPVPNTMGPTNWTFTAYTPPPRTNALIEARFEEGTGSAVTNTGTAGGSGTIDFGLASSAPGLPAFTNNVPVGPYAPAGNQWSLSTGTGTGHGQYAGKAVDFSYAVKSSTVGLEQFTVSGWLNVTDGTIGSGGNRIFGTWPNNANSVASNQLTGIDVVVTANGTLRLGVNQAPDYPTPPGNLGPISTTGKVPVSASATPANWVFFAVTYDATLGAGNVKYFFGDGNTPAALDTASVSNYNRGVVADASVQRGVTLANFVSGTPSEGTLRDSPSNSRVFRGLLDEIRFFANALTLEEIQEIQTRGGAAITAPAGIASHPVSQSVFAGQTVTFSVIATGTPPITVQWQRDGADIPGANGPSYTLPAPTGADHGAVFRATVRNDSGSETSSGATLTVWPEDGLKLRFGFAEGSGLTTTNLGNLRGHATFVQQNSLPVFSTNVPLGPYAPASNAGAVDFGTIAEGDGDRALDWGNGLTPTLGGLAGFTACGWLNVRDLTIGPGGNRLVFALDSPNGQGFDLVHLADGSLRLGVNQWPDGAEGGGPVSSTGQLTADPNASPDNWVFFAVTYDSILASEQVKYYFGSPELPVELDVARDYSRGAIAATGPATLGNFGITASQYRPAAGPTASRVFRGLMDELQVHNRVLTLEELGLLQRGLPLGVEAPTLAMVREGTQAVVSWTSTATFQLVYQDHLGAAAWTPVSETVDTVGDLHTVRVTASQPMRFYRLEP